MTLRRTPSSQYIRTIRVAKGFDGADQQIVRELQLEDLVMTADLPLAAEVVARGAHALDPRGSARGHDGTARRGVHFELISQPSVHTAQQYAPSA
jgi:uncharacterized protein YaiI (UPF0178 family)